MPTPFADHTGKQFGLWTVKSFYGRTKDNRPIWLCRCECGTEKPVIMGSLQKGRSRSCGCMSRVWGAEKITKHGMAGTPTYKSWHQMHQRCQGLHGHDHYLTRGISVCERWAIFENFYADMGLRPEGKTLDRIDNKKGYTPDNCRWATWEQQANNREVATWHTVHGKLLTVALAAREYGLHESGLRHRLRKGWTLEKAVSTPMLPRRRVNAG